MPKCKHYDICGRDADADGEFCRLHSQDPEKDRDAFERAFAEHRAKDGNNFQHFVFPGPANFREATFNKWAVFFYAEFNEGCDFSRATFPEGADFSNAKFKGSAKFVDVTFDKGAKFSHATFYAGMFADFSAATFNGWADFFHASFGEKLINSGGARFIDEAAVADPTVCSGAANFSDAIFNQDAYFHRATFAGDALFGGVTFTRGADFSGTSFGKVAEFVRARFLGRTRFLSRQEKGNDIPIFLGTLVYFREADMAPDAVVFQDADLQKCRFLGTDLRKAEFTEVQWPKKRGRLAVYDEKVNLKEGETREWGHIEQLYRQLKQNYEDRRDYEHARHFHYGEKEMRRKNPDNPLSLRLLLKLYRCVSGYGESSLRPLGWALGLLILSFFLYLLLGLQPRDESSMLSLTSPRDWLRGLHYSFQVMTLLKPHDLVPIGYAKGVRTFETLAGPILIGLFALALRQRLKR